MNYIKKIKNLLDENNGILTTSLVRENNIPTIYLTRLTKEGKLKRVQRGIYIDRKSVV